MPVSCKVGTQAWLSTDAVSTVYNITCGFQPRAVIVWISGKSGTGATRGANYSCVGFITRSAANALRQESQASSSADAAASGDTSIYTSVTHAVMQNSGATPLLGALDARAIADWPSDGFALIVADQSTASITVNYLAYGGSDLTDAFSIGFTEAGSAPLSVDYTTMGFQPSVVFFTMNKGSGGTAEGGLALDSGMGFGFAASTTTAEQYVMFGNSDQGSATIDTDRVSRNGVCTNIVTAGGVSDANATLSAFLSNGFTLQWSARAGARRYHAMGILGGTWKGGTLTTRTDTANIDTTVGFQPAGVLFASAVATALGDSVQDKRTIGATDGTSQVCAASHDMDAISNARVSVAHETDQVYLNLASPALDATAAAYDGKMAWISMLSTGFRCQMTDTDPAGNIVGFLAVDAGAPATLPPAKAYIYDSAMYRAHYW